MTNAAERLHALDMVRGTALIMGVFFHGLISFIPSDEQIWLVADEQSSPVGSVLYFVLHNFRMTTFFFIAGLFAHMSFHRRGAWAFLKDRFRRLGIPFLVGWPIMTALFIGLFIWSLKVQFDGVLPEPPEDGEMGPPGLSLTHLWFLYVLLLFCCAVLFLRVPVVLLDRSERLRAGLDKGLGKIVKTPLIVLFLALPSALLLPAYEDWMPWFGLPTPDIGFIPNSAAAAAYFTSFAFGWLLHRQVDVLETFRRTWALYLVVAIALSAYCLSVLGLTARIDSFLGATEERTYALAYSISSWCWTFAFVGFAMQFFSGESGVRRYIADASYWLYIIHLPIIIAMQVLVSRLDWSWGLKYGVILSATFAIMLLSYHYLVRFTYIGALLNGRKYRESEPAE